MVVVISFLSWWKTALELQLRGNLFPGLAQLLTVLLFLVTHLFVDFHVHIGLDGGRDLVDEIIGRKGLNFPGLRVAGTLNE